jgi:hypothetical protein
MGATPFGYGRCGWARFMLVFWSFPMVRSFHGPRSKSHRALTHLGVLTVLVSSCIVQVSAQGLRTAPRATPHHSRSTPGLHSSPNAPGGSDKAIRGVLPGSTAPGFATSDQWARRPEPAEDDSSRFAMALATDPFPFVIGVGDSYASSAGSGFRHAGTLGLRPRLAGGLDAFSVARIRVALQNEQAFFPPSIFPRILGEGANASGRSSSTLFSLATLSGIMRGDFYLPLGSPARGLRFDYDDDPRPSIKMARISGAATAMFTSSGSLLRNGMTLSAGALLGVRSTDFPAGRGLHGMASAAEKSTVPSLALRLSF